MMYIPKCICSRVRCLDTECDMIPLHLMTQMILVSITFFGCIVADEVFTVGFVMEKLEGTAVNS